MSKTITFRGQLPIGEQDRIRLRTLKGKVGYKITKFQTISSAPNVTAHDEVITKIFKKDQTGSITSTIDFTDSDLLAVAYYEDNDQPAYTASQYVIFDNETFNQDIFIYSADVGGGTKPINYYIEIEAMPLSDIESTMLTLKSLRTVTSR